VNGITFDAFNAAVTFAIALRVFGLI